VLFDIRLLAVYVKFYTPVDNRQAFDPK